MTDEELLEWYKNNNAAKPADMSQQDYELNMNKALKLQTDKQLQTNLANQQAAIAKSQQAAQQSASISNEKLLKYLGQNQIANNVASGQKSSDYIATNNNYMQTRAKIANEAAQKQIDLLDKYNTTKLNNETDTYDNQISSLDKYRQREIEDDQRAKAEEDRQLNKKQVELDMKIREEQLRQTIDDHETSKEEKVKAKQEVDDLELTQVVFDRIQAYYDRYADENGEVNYASSELQDAINKELEKYKSKFNNEKYYNYLLELYQSSLIGNRGISSIYNWE